MPTESVDEREGKAVTESEVQSSKPTDLATAILLKKQQPNSLLIDDSAVDDHYTVALSPAKMTELNLLSGDTVLLKGKKRKTTVAIVTSDDGLMDGKMRMGKVIRANLR